MNHLILILEDDPLLRNGMRALLGPLGHPLDVAGTVGEARAHLAVAHPSHAILDLNLPDGTGVDVLRDLRARGPLTRVMILTAAADGRLVAAARALGVDCVLTKPADWDRVLQWADRPPGGGMPDGAAARGRRPDGERG